METQTIPTIKFEVEAPEFLSAIETTLQAFANHSNGPSKEESNAALELIELQKKVRHNQCFIETEHLQRTIKAIHYGIRFFTLTHDGLIDDEERAAIFDLINLAIRLAEHSK